MEVGRVESSFQSINLKKFTSGLASQFRHVMAKGNLHYEVNLDEISEPIFIDSEMWEKIVLNLLSNAFKFTLNGSMKVFLKEFSDRVEFTFAILVSVFRRRNCQKSLIVFIGLKK